jgi:hypothetical protein
VGFFSLSTVCAGQKPPSARAFLRANPRFDKWPLPWRFHHQQSNGNRSHAEEAGQEHRVVAFMMSRTALSVRCLYRLPAAIAT